MTRSATDQFEQNVRLTLEQTFAPYLRLDGTGNFDHLDQSMEANSVQLRSDEWRAGGSARLRFGPPILNGELTYDRRDAVTGAVLSTARAHTVSELYGARASWRPADWPSLELRLSRSNAYDISRQLADASTDDALISTEYAAYRQLRLSYSLEYTRGAEHLSGTETTVVQNAARAFYNDSFNGGRTAVLASYQFSTRLSDTSIAAGIGGTVATPQLPMAGLSLVEAFPALPQTDTLLQNPGLVDGNLTAGASLNLGYSISAAGDTNLRDIGAQFADPTTAVNTLYVWVDRQLPVEVWSTYAWTAYRSDDNMSWTPVSVVGAPTFSAFQNRFEISIARTQARYLKVVTRPLGPGVTTDRRFADVLVTELQALLTVPAQSVRGSRSTTAQTISGTLRQQLLGQPRLQYDLSTTFTQATGSTFFNVQQGLSLDHRLAPTLALNARVARQDSGQSSTGQALQHSGQFQYAASLIATPLATLTDSLTYTGQYAQRPRGTSTLNALTLMSRAQLYRGLDALASATYAYNVLETGALTQGPTLVAALSAAPNPALTVSTSYFLGSLRQTGGGLPSQRSDTERVDASLTFSPVAALYVTGTASRLLKGTRPTTLGSISGNFAPFPDGAVVLRASYTQAFDTAQRLKQGTGVAGVRWNLRPGAYLDLAYTGFDFSSDAGSGYTRSYTASFFLQL